MAYVRTLLTDYAGHILITKTWTASLPGWDMYVRRKATTKPNPGISEEYFGQLKARFLEEISMVAVLRNISDSLIINWTKQGLG